MSRRLTRKLTQLFIILALSLATVYFKQHQPATISPASTQHQLSGLTPTEVIKNAFVNQQGNFQVMQTGRIIKLMKDDNYGPRHQRFLVELDDGQKLLIAHNTDLAPRIEDIKTGEIISFYGEYEWNNKGGVIHWTHHDPRKKHPDGWLIYGNRKFQ